VELAHKSSRWWENDGGGAERVISLSLSTNAVQVHVVVGLHDDLFNGWIGRFLVASNNSKRVDLVENGGWKSNIEN